MKKTQYTVNIIAAVFGYLDMVMAGSMPTKEVNIYSLESGMYLISKMGLQYHPRTFSFIEKMLGRTPWYNIERFAKILSPGGIISFQTGLRIRKVDEDNIKDDETCLCSEIELLSGNLNENIKILEDQKGRSLLSEEVDIILFKIAKTLFGKSERDCADSSFWSGINLKIIIDRGPNYAKAGKERIMEAALLRHAIIGTVLMAESLGCDLTEEEIEELLI